MSEELLPCPICSKQPVMRESRNCFGMLEGDVNLCCRDDTHTVSVWGKSKSEAIKLWNARARIIPQWLKDEIEKKELTNVDEHTNYISDYHEGRSDALNWVLSLEEASQ